MNWNGKANKPCGKKEKEREKKQKVSTNSLIGITETKIYIYRKMRVTIYLTSKTHKIQAIQSEVLSCARYDNNIYWTKPRKFQSKIKCVWYDVRCSREIKSASEAIRMNRFKWVFKKFVQVAHCEAYKRGIHNTHETHQCTRLTWWQSLRSYPSKPVKMDTKQGRFQVHNALFRHKQFFIGYLPSKKCTSVSENHCLRRNERKINKTYLMWCMAEKLRITEMEIQRTAWIQFFSLLNTYTQVMITTIILFFSFSFVLHSRRHYQKTHIHSHFFCLSASKKKELNQKHMPLSSEI